MNRMKLSRTILPLLLMIAMLFPVSAHAASPAEEFSGAAAIELSHNIPALSAESAADGDFISYSELDELGRPGAVTACLSRASLSSGLRSDSAPLPVGWVTTRYFNDAGESRYLYCLCSVLAPALGGDASDARNVFTGTRTLRDEGMQPYADKVADYLSRTANHVLYRVTPAYHGDDLVPFGVQLEAQSVEDAGRAIRFNVFLYNVERGFSIDYRTGESVQDGTTAVAQTGQGLLASHDFPVPAATVTSKYGTFEALYEALTKQTSASQTQSTSSLSIPRKVWAVKGSTTDRKFHKTDTCSNTSNPTAYTVESVVKALEPCEACWTPAEYSYLMDVHNGTATLNTSASQSQNTSGGNTQSQSASSASQATPTPSQSTAAQAVSTPAPSNKPDLLSLGSNLLSSALSSDSTMVWVSSVDKLYHRDGNCSNLDTLYAYQKTMDWANVNGYAPCPYCS